MTRALMGSSALFLAVAGVTATFLPQELLGHLGAEPQGPLVLAVQLLGALYLGLAALNWMNRGNRIGGIYARPVSMANFIHFAIGAMALLKGLFHQPLALDVAAMAAVYTIFAVWFGLVVFMHPGANAS
jgi:hypothetical protein